MVDGKDEVIKRRLIASHISAQWIVVEQNMIFSTGYIGKVC